MVARIGEHEDHDGHRPVALLECEPAFERLQIPEVRLGLNADRPTHPAHDCVPGAEIAGSFDRRSAGRHLGSPPQPGAKPSLEAPEQGNMPGITKRLPAREPPRAQIQPHERTELRNSNHREVWRSAAADPSDLLTGETQRSTQRCVAQPAIEPSFLELAAELLNEASTPRRSPVERARSQGHT